MNYRERIVYQDLKELGYEISLPRYEEAGYPDFKVFSFETKEKFYVEVKNSITGQYSQIQFNGSQGKVFQELVKKGNIILIAIPQNGVLTYTNFETKTLWRKAHYGTVSLEAPKFKCPKCNYEWETRVEKPRACPRCKSRLDI